MQLPTPLDVTRPFSSTVATLVLLDLYVTFLLAASEGETVTLTCEVSAVFGYAGTTVVIIRHGNYLSVYCDLASVSVSRGQKVSARQNIGRLGSDGTMQFQLRKGAAKLNPESWLAR